MFLSGLQIIGEEALTTLYPIYALAIVFIATKGLGMLMRKIGLPQVVGMVIAGLLIGPAFFFMKPGGFHGIIDTDIGSTADVLAVFSQIGVIFILFSSGLETDVQQLKKSGLVATLIALAGVFVPMALGFIGTMFFMPGGIGSAEAWGSDYVLNAVFVGAILAATSVGITVETLRELGKLNGKIGQTIVSAAIIDDVIGILVVSVVTGLKGGNDANPVWWVIVKILLFFVVSIGAGIGLRYFFKWMIKKYPNKRRTSILAIAMCFLYAFMAEVVFGVATITGAYVAGLMLSGLKDSKNIDESGVINKKVITVGYLLFSPVFFANVGISANFSNFQPVILGVAAVFVVLGIVGKIIGCGAVARACRFDNRESMQIGCGMIARGEVALAVYAAGSSMIAPVNGIDPMIPTVFLILVSSILCPILLKLLFKNKKGKGGEEKEIPAEERLDENIGEHGREEGVESGEEAFATPAAGPASEPPAEPSGT